MTFITVVMLLFIAGVGMSATIVNDDRGPNWLVRDVTLDEWLPEFSRRSQGAKERVLSIAKQADDSSVVVCVVRMFGDLRTAQLYRAVQPHPFFVPHRDPEPYMYGAKIQQMRERSATSLPVAEYIRVDREKDIVARLGLGSHQRRPMRFATGGRLQNLALVEVTTMPTGPAAESPGLVLFLYLERSDIDSARLVYDVLRTSVGLRGSLTVYVRSDLWFAGLTLFPAFSLATGDLREAPGWSAWRATKSFACGGSDRYPEACWTEPGSVGH